MRISDYTLPELVAIGLPGRDVDTVIDGLIDQLARWDERTGTDPLREVLREQERAVSTALDCGMAVPHATLAGLDRPVIIVGTTPHGVACGRAGIPPVRLFLLVLSPPDQAGLHIKLLARVARFTHRPGFVEQLATASSTDDLLARLGHLEAGH